MVKPVAYSFRFDSELREQLERFAREEGRTLANYIEWVLRQHATEREKREGKRK